MVVLDTIPEHSEGNCLAVVHVALGGVVAKDTVDHCWRLAMKPNVKTVLLTNLFFALIEPAFFATELASRLCGRRREIEPRDDTDEACQHAFESKKPSL